MTRGGAQGAAGDGLHTERTDLAWRRTLLSITVGGLVGLRFLPGAVGAWSVAVCLVGLATTGVLWVLSRRRSRDVSAVVQDPSLLLPDGALLLALATLLAAATALALGYVALAS